MFFYTLYKSKLWSNSNLDPSRRRLRIFMLASVIYIIVYSYLTSNYMINNSSVDTLKKILYCTIIFDGAISVYYILNKQQCKDKKKGKDNQMGDPYYSQMDNPYYNQIGNPHYNQMDNPYYNKMGQINNQIGNPNHNQMGQINNPNHYQMGNPHYNQMDNPHKIPESRQNGSVLVQSNDNNDTNKSKDLDTKIIIDEQTKQSEDSVFIKTSEESDLNIPTYRGTVDTDEDNDNIPIYKPQTK